MVFAFSVARSQTDECDLQRSKLRRCTSVGLHESPGGLVKRGR